MGRGMGGLPKKHMETTTPILQLGPFYYRPTCNLQVLAIEFVLLAIDFVRLANKFVPLVIEFVPLAIEFVLLAIEFVTLARNFVILEPSLVITRLTRIALSYSPKL